MSSLFGETDDPAQGAAQPYRVLARKYRPSTFAELIGQEAMVRTLTGALEAGRLPQAWILTGVRGIGKTTTARLVAKALNCTSLQNRDGVIEPCNVCETCRAIAEDRHVDVQEMDAASRTGVDDIREIIEGVRYGPVSARYKIYILDEVHMLSKNAFNALLKTLEEPPPHVKFIFATTEIRKVPVTVLSRCQRFDLRRISSAQLAAHFQKICGLEKIEAEEEAVRLIAIAADGSVRDGLSLLDQAIARAGEGKVTESDVKDMLGLADRAAGLALCRNLLRGETAAALEAFAGMLAAGCDPLQLLQDQADWVHLLSRAQVAGKNDAWAEGERELADDLADIKIPALTRSWQILLKGLGEVQSAANAAAAAEMVLIRLAYAAELPLPSDLIRRLREQKEMQPQPFSGGGGQGQKGGSMYGGAQASAMQVGAVQTGVATGRAGQATARVLQSTPAMRPQALGAAQVGAVHADAAQASAAFDLAPMPTSFEALAELFVQKREASLYAELCNYAHLVRLGPARLEIRLEGAASTNLLGRVSQCLSAWTGQRWGVSLSDQEGEPTLTERRKAAEKAHLEQTESHPLMQAARQAFSGATLLALKPKALPEPPQASEEDEASSASALSGDEPSGEDD